MTARTSPEDRRKADRAVERVRLEYRRAEASGAPEPVLTASKAAALVGLDVTEAPIRLKRSRVVLVRSRLEAAVQRGELQRSRALDAAGREVVAYDPAEKS